MDWHSWLSRSNLEATLVHEYGLAFVQNELEEEDLAYFNHDFLQSLGIFIAKHRLEILKLARKGVRGRTSSNGFSKLVVVMNKTRKLFTRNISKLGFHRNPTPSDLTPYRDQWSGVPRRIGGGRERRRDPRAVISGGNVMWSGPLDKRAEERFVLGKNQAVSGPLDVKMMQDGDLYRHWSPIVKRANGRSGLVCRSPTLSGPVDGLGLSPQVSFCRSTKVCDGHHDRAQSPWSVMFQDLKPT